ncbi:hypothetical protein Desor_2328 [Desulfosporosinus orientis DSM 765]|uniref:Uncharacterized protein n=1 Tax=Desulfosporosinus orientis (strain ATCC 19365 / DSM 765 / NCIMB 8382 / VKM B-1628 / Singapore I) TaxID=768706 RepID=G7WDF0_DESOD|nr:hypothetical protein [Desulfosporosinus orientis]AET67919.1 hypothetical protein Desor_2328 [Desulfosporosinus orientis DSM 765]
MKRWLALITTVFGLCLLGSLACAKSIDIPPSEVIVDSQPNGLDNNLAPDKVNRTKTLSPPGDIKFPESNTTEESTSQAVGESLRNEPNGDITIITKSNNAYTDAQKLETLEELTGEIDKLIESLKNLEDVPDSELSFEWQGS